MKFQGGPKEAARMLAGLPKDQRDKVLEEIVKQDPSMAEVLKNLMVTLDDLQFITVKMLVELLREIDIKDLALGMRLSQSKELKDFVLGNVSKSMRQEMEEVLLGPPQSVNKAQEAYEKVMEVVRQKIDKGELIINRSQDMV